MLCLHFLAYRKESHETHCILTSTCTIAAALACATALAQPTNDARARYEEERRACMTQNTGLPGYLPARSQRRTRCGGQRPVEQPGAAAQANARERCKVFRRPPTRRNVCAGWSPPPVAPSQAAGCCANPSPPPTSRAEPRHGGAGSAPERKRGYTAPAVRFGCVRPAERAWRRSPTCSPACRKSRYPPQRCQHRHRPRGECCRP